MRILFNFASRSRPEKFKRVCRQINSLCQGNNHKILAKVDTDDPEFNEYSAYNNVVIVPGLSDNKIHAINRDIPENGWDILVDVSDDFVFIKKGFDNVIRYHCGPDDCVHFPEPFAAKQAKMSFYDNIIIMAVMGRDYYNRFGYIYNPVYKSLFCDNELTAVAKLTGRYKFINNQIFYHAHPAAGFGKPDAQTKFTESFWAEDENTYKQRKSNGFP